MRVLFAGTPEVAVPSLEAILEAGHDVVAVLTRPPAPAGRGRHLADSAVAGCAKQLGLRVLTPAHPRDQQFQDALAELAPDVCPVVAYGALLPKRVLDVPRHGWVNLHFSVLPRWRGAAPVQRAIIAGDRETGATTFEIVPELDAGPVYLSRSEPLDPLATAGEVLAALSVSGASLLVETLDLIASGTAPTPQPSQGVTLAPKLTTEGARIDWRLDPHTLHNHVRGHSPDPGAWTLWRGQRLKVLATRPADVGGLAPGQLRVTKRQVWAGAVGGAVELVQVQPVGKKPMPAADWARGGVPDGSVLG
ncbi:MAG: methionyl-tRNA formyltransferase [Propionibacteriaceae bacterium]|nr:methionyl-tRNA formyltransferase [Propionibacteriaceae bacterium]